MLSNLHRDKIFIRGVTLLVALVSFVSPAGSQAKPQNQSNQAIKVTTHLVVLNVVVTDRKGHPVTTLSKDDFRVSENEQRQSIDTFEAPAAPPSGNGEDADSSGASVMPVMVQGGRARTIIVLDELNTISEDIMFAAVKIQKYLEAQPAILKQPTTIYLLTKRKLELFAAATRDRNGLLAKLKTNFIELPPHYLQSGGAQGGTDRLLASLIALDEIALANAGERIRKNVIWIGNGIPILSNSYISGRDSEKFQNWVHYTANWLEETQTTVYTVDPRGVEVAPGVAATGGYFTASGMTVGGLLGPDFTSSELVFEAIAPESGGAIIRRRNDLDVAISDAVEDGSSYYTLSYYPSDRNWDGKYRKIRVEAGPDLVARTQRGYYAYAEGFQSTDEQIDWSLSRAVTSPVLFNNIALKATGQHAEATAAEKKGKNGIAAARLLLSVDRESLSWDARPDGDQRSELTLVTSEISSSGKVLGYHVREVEFVQQKSAATASEAVQLTVRTELPAKTDRIRVVLRDATTGRIGTFDLPVSTLAAAN